MKQFRSTTIRARYLQFTETTAGVMKKSEINCSNTIKDVDMKTVIVKWIKALAFGCAAITFIGCNNTDEPAEKGNVQFELTDAPADDENVRNVFVTIADIKVDGKSIGGVEKTTLDLKAYSQGQTKVIAMASQFNAKTYNNVTLVLDLNSDANGAYPGCFIQMVDGTRYKLKNTPDGTTEVTIFKEYEVNANATTKMVLDFVAHGYHCLVEYGLD